MKSSSNAPAEGALLRSRQQLLQQSRGVKRLALRGAGDPAAATGAGEAHEFHGWYNLIVIVAEDPG